MSDKIRAPDDAPPPAEVSNIGTTSGPVRSIPVDIREIGDGDGLTVSFAGLLGVRPKSLKPAGRGAGSCGADPQILRGDMEMSDKMSERVMHFGKHKGRALTEVPTDYLEWVLENVDRGHIADWAEDELEDRYTDPSHPLYEPED